MITFTIEEVDCTPHQVGQTKNPGNRAHTADSQAKARITSEKARMHQKTPTLSHIDYYQKVKIFFLYFSLLRSRSSYNDRLANHLYLHSYPVHKLSDFTYLVVIAQ